MGGVLRWHGANRRSDHGRTWDDHGAWRNQITGGGDGLVRGHELAHAELNALLAVNLQSDRRVVHQWSLYDHGAMPIVYGGVLHVGIRILHYAARDAYAGSVNCSEQPLILSTSQFASRTPMIRRLRYCDRAESGIDAVHVRIALAAIHSNMARRCAAGVALGERLFRSKLLSQMRPRQYNW